MVACYKCRVSAYSDNVNYTAPSMNELCQYLNYGGLPISISISSFIICDDNVGTVVSDNMSPVLNHTK